MDTAKSQTNRIPDLRSVALIGMCFLLSSTAYLAWLYHLIPMVAPQTADLLSLGAGYLFQAAGIGLFVLFLTRSRIPADHFLWLVLVLLVLCLFPAVSTGSPLITVSFGFALNVLCGILSGYFLYILTSRTGTANSAITLGLGYSLSIIASWLLSLLGSQPGHYPRLTPFICLLLAVAVFLITSKSRKEAVITEDGSASSDETASQPIRIACADDSDFKIVLLLSGGLVLLFSVVNTCGFGFPSADVGNEISLELSRLFYAAGLILAGIANDKSRRLGALCAFAALSIPFLMLALNSEPVPLMIFWGLSYFASGFYSVYRIILFSDIARESGILWLSGFGLLIGRVGDALGEFLHVAFSGRFPILIILNAVLFIFAVFLFFRVQQSLYSSDDHERNEAAYFDRFSSRHDLSLREREVLKLLLQEKTNIEIADELSVSESTVKFHVHNLLQKTGCHNRVALLDSYRNGRNS